MVNLAGIFFLIALVLIGLDLSSLEFARGAGLASNLFLLLALACLLVDGVREHREHGPGVGAT